LPVPTTGIGDDPSKYHTIPTNNVWAITPSIASQCVLFGNVCDYYSNRGYVKASSNKFDSIPEMSSTPFSQHHVHFVSDDMQDEVAPEL
jgi:hypothetical protein